VAINPKGGNVSNGNGNKTASEMNKERLVVVEARIKELEPKKDEPLARKELGELYTEKIKLSQPEEQPKDFKIAEIWVKNDQIALDAVPGFWQDKLRAIGILEYCKDIVKESNKPEPKISIVDKLGFKRFVNGIKKRF